MSVFIFTGPTLSAADARAELDAIYLPPAGEGDLSAPPYGAHRRSG